MHPRISLNTVWSVSHVFKFGTQDICLSQVWQGPMRVLSTSWSSLIQVCIRVLQSNDSLKPKHKSVNYERLSAVIFIECVDFCHRGVSVDLFVKHSTHSHLARNFSLYCVYREVSGIFGDLQNELCCSFIYNAYRRSLWRQLLISLRNTIICIKAIHVNCYTKSV